MRNYLDLLKKVMETGTDKQGRNGVTRSLFAEQLRFDLSKGFPAVTTKKLAFKAVVGELLWFISGSGDDNDLKRIMGTERTIWTDNAEDPKWTPKASHPGDLGRVYGRQWREFNTPIFQQIEDRVVIAIKATDQLATVVDQLRNDPFSRRIILSAWNPGELDQMSLPPCHVFAQFVVTNGKLNCAMTMRSADLFLGVPFNIASYALITHMLAQVTNLTPGELVLTLNDCHVYHAHFDAVNEQLSREPYPLPTLRMNPDVKDIDVFRMEDFQLIDYQHHPAIKAPMIV